MNSLTSESGQRSYDHAITDFVEWYCSEPRLAFNRTVVLRYRDRRDFGKIDQQRQSPETKTMLRELIDGLSRGQPDYALAGGYFVSVLRRLVGQYKPLLADHGSLKSTTFEGVTLDGEDIYHLEFAKGSMDWRIGLGADGKIASAGVVAGSD